MSRGTHARGDGSFGRSAGAQTLKGAVLLIIAIVIGVLLLHTAPASVTTVSAAPRTSTTKAPKAKAKSSKSPPTSALAALPTTTTAAPAHPPGQVKVAVANGSGVPGLAGRIRLQLNSAG